MALNYNLNSWGISLFRFIKKMAQKLGVDIIKYAPPVDFVASDMTGNDPRYYAYLAKGRSFITEIPIEKCMFMGVLAYQAGKKSDSPFVVTLNDYLTKEHTTYVGSYLEKYYANFQPKTANDLLNLDGEISEIIKSHFPKPSARYWLYPPNDVQGKRLDQVIKSENHRYGLKAGIEAGHPWYGPVSKEKGELEFYRLTNVLDKIKDEGFRYSIKGIDNIKGFFVVKNDDWRFVVIGGHHRVAALSALNYKTIIVQTIQEGLNGIVSIDDIKYLPIVIEGYLSHLHAESIFESYFRNSKK